MNSRERLQAAIEHRKPDRVPIDLGSTKNTGISASVLYNMRKALGLPEKDIHVEELFWLLGRVDEDVRRLLGVDVVGIGWPADVFGVKHTGGKPFKMNDGTPLIIGNNSAINRMPDGNTYLYPQGDISAQPSAVMPPEGYFFDSIDRVEPFDESNLTPLEDFKDDFKVIDDETAKYLEKQSIDLYEGTEYGIVGFMGGGGLGETSRLPGMQLKHPKGIRKFADWLAAHLLYPEYLHAIFQMQTEIILKNFEIYKQAVGERIQVIGWSCTDFGTQHGPFISPELFRTLYKPYYKKMNDWVHQNTNWKTYYHCCGSVVALLDDFVDMGMDILNPIQLSAKDMDAHMLKEKYGDKLVFWGGAVDTQATLPFGTPQQVREQVLERMEILSANGGYVFNGIHNIVAKTPAENVIAMYRAAAEFNQTMYS